MTESIKMLKLSTGEDIICTVKLDSLKTSELKIKNPQKISLIQSPTHLGMALIKWVPWEFDQVIPLNKKHVVTIINCHRSLLAYYNKTNEKIKNHKSKGNYADDGSVAITGQSLKDTVSTEMENVSEQKIQELMDRLMDKDEENRLDDIMDGLNKDDETTFH